MLPVAPMPVALLPIALLPIALLLMALLLPGCWGDSGQGPAKVHWDRDIGEKSGMIISDRRFAAQAVEPGGRAHKFDDIGGLVIWLADRPWKDQARIWVRDTQADRWLEPSRATWKKGLQTPSGYGYGASAEPGYGEMSFEQVRQEILRGQSGIPNRENR